MKLDLTNATALLNQAKMDYREEQQEVGNVTMWSWSEVISVNVMKHRFDLQVFRVKKQAQSLQNGWRDTREGELQMQMSTSLWSKTTG